LNEIIVRLPVGRIKEGETDGAVEETSLGSHADVRSGADFCPVQENVESRCLIANPGQKLLLLDKVR
jgi:hypothetical protein